MKRFFFFTILCSIFFSLFWIAKTPTFAEDDQAQQLEQKKQEIEELEKKLNDTAAKKVTLASTLEKIATQISLTETNIQKTQLELNLLNKQIDDLNITIGGLEQSLDLYSLELLTKLQQEYKLRQSQPIEILLVANGINDFMRKYKYVQVTQNYIQKTITRLETQKSDYDHQKTLKEVKQQEVEQKKLELANQQAQLLAERTTQSNLLEQTKNDEQKFQELLQQARAEYEALQAIIAGKGEESEVGEVNEQDTIATIINGASCNSSGRHLHFTVVKADGSVDNPFNYLKSVDYTNCSGRPINPETKQVECQASDSFNPSGNWSWPVDPPVYMTQGYGVTWSISHDWVGEIYSSHNGIDITGSGLNVKAVQTGILYQGAYTGTDDCKLKYVRVKHKDGINSYYLHVNY